MIRIVSICRGSSGAIWLKNIFSPGQTDLFGEYEYCHQITRRKPLTQVKPALLQNVTTQNIPLHHV
jgi:hypothetical protein